MLRFEFEGMEKEGRSMKDGVLNRHEELWCEKFQTFQYRLGAVSKGYMMKRQTYCVTNGGDEMPHVRDGRQN